MESDSERKIWHVTELTRDIKTLLEDRYAFIWITGEITNFRPATSGHLYFTLKDARAQIAAAMFKGQARNLRFVPEDGLSVVGFGRVTVYEPRGAYQIILEYLEPAGIGSLQLAFEQLKRRLAEEGLFDPGHKKPIPPFPRAICLITSPTGAAVRDFLKVMNRRFPNMAVDILPVRVQGAGADTEIAEAISLMNALGRVDVGVVTRGGGSMEDLAAFNSESVARAIFASRVPIVSAVGHEIDFTIADFIADLRAPTPSTAAEMVVPDKSALLRDQLLMREALVRAMGRVLERCRSDLLGATRRLVDPRRRLEAWRERLMALKKRLSHWPAHTLFQYREKLAWRRRSLLSCTPSKKVEAYRGKHQQIADNLLGLLKSIHGDSKRRYRECHRVLVSLGPLNILARGYSITRIGPGGPIATDAADILPGTYIDVQLLKGTLDAQVLASHPDALPGSSPPGDSDPSPGPSDKPSTKTQKDTHGSQTPI